jgi:flagellar export protein FliJ
MKHALNLLMEQLDRQQDDLGRRMSNIQARLQKSLQTRDSLTGYLMDYRQQQITQGGHTGAQLRSQGRFLTRIEGVLQQQSADVTKLQSELDRISQDLLQVRVQRLRYEALLSRVASREEQVRNQRDQKVTDELSGRRAAAKVLEARRRTGI